ncbi:MAG TPA: GNAT family N-acetyltransferase [Candidatus Limnocylindrales bacterium]|nr:GNAT family N-acetyltransferase [Candidatus Limnocylindrales bacterium]
MGVRGADAAILTPTPGKDRSWPLVVRRAREDDRDAVLSFATRTWHDWDYIPHAWPIWLEAKDGAFLVGTVGEPADVSPASLQDAEGNPLAVGQVVAITRVAMVSRTEAWLEGIRVDPRVRGMGVASDLQIAELHWVAGQDAQMLRYATGSNNEGSHRLGARDGIVVVARFHAWWWSATGNAEDDADELSAFDSAVREQTTRNRQAALQSLAEVGLVVGAAGFDRLWQMIDNDPTFIAGQRLYEPRPWGLQELTPELFHRHMMRGEVIADGHEAVAILVGEQLPAEDSSLRLATLVGRGPAAAELAGRMRRVIGYPFRFRVPVESPMIAGHEQLFRNEGFVTPEWELHVLARPMEDPEQPIPADDPRRVVLAEPPDALEPPRW